MFVFTGGGEVTTGGGGEDHWLIVKSCGLCLQEAERQHLEEVEKIRQEKQELSEKLQDMIHQETILTAKMESLQADNDITREQLAAMKGMEIIGGGLKKVRKYVGVGGGGGLVYTKQQKY